MPQLKVLNAATYPRVSTMRQVQEGFSLEAQRENLSYFARGQGWNVVGDYGDEGISAKNVEDRPGVKRLIADIKNGKVDVVVLYKFDRLTRDARDTEDFIELIQNYNILVYTLSGGFVDVSTPSGRFNTRILGAAAQFERETTIDRVIDGNIKKVKKGYSLCSCTSSYGYDRPKHQEVQTINPKEAEVVKRVFKMYSKGKTFTEICDVLNSEKISPKNKGKIRKRRNSDEYYTVNSVWQPKTIRNMLSNVNYIGYVRYGCEREQVSLDEAANYENRGKGFITKGLHEAIIDIKLWDEVQSLLSKIKSVHKTNYSKNDVYYCGFLICGFCGQSLTTNRTNHKRKDNSIASFLGYRCVNREKHLCPALGMSHNKVEIAFLNYMDKIQDFDDIDNLELDENINTLELDNLKKRLLQRNNKLKEIMKLFMDDLLNYEEYINMKEAIEKEIVELKKMQEKEEIKLKPKNKYTYKKDIAKNIKEHWKYLFDEEKREFLIRFVKEIIIVNKDKDRHNGLPEILDVKFYND